MFLPILISTTLFLTPVWTSRTFDFSWGSAGENYEYVFEVYTDRELTNLYMALPPTTNTYVNPVYHDTGLFFQRIKYYPISSPNDFSYSYLGQFYLNLEKGIVSEDIPYFPPEEEEGQEENQIEEEIVTLPLPQEEEELIEEEQEVLGISHFNYSLPSLVDYREVIPPLVPKTDTKINVANRSTVCKISLLRNEEETSVKSWDCNIDIQVTEVKYVDLKKYITLDVSGKYPERINAQIQIYTCKAFSVFDSSTWGKCKEILFDTYNGEISLFNTVYLKVNGKTQVNSQFSFTDTNFWIKNILKEDISSKDIKLNMTLYSQFKGKQWYELEYIVRKDISLPKLEKGYSTKPFEFPLDRLIGVTQWHGCTQYQCPHKGIDFGARLNSVLAIGDGKVVNVGFDRYGGECNQGGNFVIVRHDNGMHSAYIHLDSYSVKIGSKVKKGGLIGISGNTGKKNCQPLGYHLHFEVRNGLSSSTHVNPVDFVNVDWSLIPTLGTKQFPGRLGGDNPHPTF